MAVMFYHDENARLERIENAKGAVNIYDGGGGGGDEENCISFKCSSSSYIFYLYIANITILYDVLLLLDFLTLFSLLAL